MFFWEKTSDQHLVVNLKIIFTKFYFNYLVFPSFFSFFEPKMLEGIFQTVFGMGSTLTLVKIYNNVDGCFRPVLFFLVFVAHSGVRKESGNGSIEKK